ncbi:hypothetical protein HYPSUDRAFT_129597 [Hypholoma sublateritium FD-334 SS-4]|uniref:F-box domain-containing protein n=1 Tax=Hypholoma sublateritium (strain FD-334 SS-4) TaxID=945553 RepID=A0A0D2QAB0_HYPSF|nr:hypothetical protein HYPSUDRAFT_129597 [Hypholoma sublateritium FD-334 SS-4]
MSSKFDELPVELYDAIFSYVEPSDLQGTMLAVTRAIPFAAVPLQHLFRNLQLERPEQTIQLYNRIRPRNARGKARRQVMEGSVGTGSADSEQPVAWVKELAVKTWTVDADVLLNLVRLLPNLQSLTLWIGPTNFSPEHLEELLAQPLEHLRYLSLRFRPYVEKVTYYQFLKGAYFDSTLTVLAEWPANVISTLSIVQDPIDAEMAQKQDFAQPIVFFRLDLFPLLSSPAIASTLENLRIRIPSRPVARSICGSLPASSPFDSNRNLILPRLEFLDLSTSSVLDTEVDSILARFATIKHLVLDRCAVLRGDLREGEGGALGKRLALIGVRRAKDREKALKAWLESRVVVAEAIPSDGAPAVDQGAGPAGRRPRPGRKGLATATISFRTTHGKTSGKRSGKKRNAPMKKADKQRATRIRVLPALPSLVSLSVTLSPVVKPERYPAIRSEFTEGWSEGIAQLAVTRARLRTSATNGYRIMVIGPTDSDDEDSDGSVERDSLKEGLYGLAEVDLTDPEAFSMPAPGEILVPTLCFAGAGIEGAHEAHCGHSVGWVAMKDEI